MRNVNYSCYNANIKKLNINLVAKRLVLVAVLLIITGVVASFINLFNMYGKVGSDSCAFATCDSSLSKNESIAHLTITLTTVGTFILVAVLVILVFNQMLTRKSRSKK
jgi:glucan phosphoethanolaminetransferase (alkaline phosphatase superfamily)